MELSAISLDDEWSRIVTHFKFLLTSSKKQFLVCKIPVWLRDYIVGVTNRLHLELDMVGVSFITILWMKPIKAPFWDRYLGSLYNIKSPVKAMPQWNYLRPSGIAFFFDSTLVVAFLLLSTKRKIETIVFFLPLLVCTLIKFGLVIRGQSHKLDVNHCVWFGFRRSPGASQRG